MTGNSSSTSLCSFMQKSFRRRSLLSGVSATCGSRLLPAGLILGTIPETATANPAAVMIALQLMGALSSLANQASSGLAEQFQAINIKLDQVLDNQVRIMSAIATVQQSLDALRNDIQGLLTFDLYRMLAIDIAEHNMRLQQFSQSVKSDVESIKHDATKKAEYQALLLDVRKLATRFSTTVSYTDLLQQNVGSKGSNSILIIAPALVVLPYSLRLLYALEGLYDDVGWKLLDYQQVYKTLVDAFSSFRSTHLKQVADFHTRQANGALNDWWNKFKKSGEEDRVVSMDENTQKIIPGDGINIIATEQYTAVRCYVSKQFRTGPIDHGLFYKRVFNVKYDQETESVPFSWVASNKIDAFVKVTPKSIAHITSDWYDLEYHGFLADEPRVVSIGDRFCVELTDKEVGQSAKKPYDYDADKKKVLQQFQSEFVEAADQRNQAILQLIQVERVTKIARFMHIYAINFVDKMSDYLEIENELKPHGGFHWKPFDPKTEIADRTIEGQK